MYYARQVFAEIKLSELSYSAKRQDYNNVI